MFHLSRRSSNWIFQGLFWVSIAAGLILMAVVLVMGWQLYSKMGGLPLEPRDEEVFKEVDPGVVIATGALALFTAFLWCSAAITARFARAEILTSSAVSSADLTLKLDNRFNSDRALRIRHGAVRFLAEERGVPIDCHDDITPYHTDPSNLWFGLPSDLIDLFNYFDWIGYLTSEESKAIDREVVRQKLGPWIINYYEMCRAEIDDVQEHHRDRWIYLEPLYKHLIDKQKKWFADHKEPLPRLDEDEERANFLQREHVRSHRGFHPAPSSSHNVHLDSGPGSEPF
jgi:hypothetical protein